MVCIEGPLKRLSVAFNKRRTQYSQSLNETRDYIQMLTLMRGCYFHMNDQLVMHFHVLYFHVLYFNVPQFYVLHFYVRDSHAWQIGPSFSCPASSIEPMCRTVLREFFPIRGRNLQSAGPATDNVVLTLNETHHRQRRRSNLHIVNSYTINIALCCILSS